MTRRREALAIVADVAARHGVPVDTVMSPKRSHVVLAARYEAYCAIALAYQSWSMVKIAQFFGRDPTSVVHAFQTRGYPHLEFQPPNGTRKSPRIVRQDCRSDLDSHDQALPSMFPMNTKDFPDADKACPGAVNV